MSFRPYDYGYYMPDSASIIGGLAFIVMIALFVVFVVLCVLLYVRFLGKNSAGNRQTRWGRFFNFDRMYLEKILKALYLFSVVAIAVIGVGLFVLPVVLALRTSVYALVAAIAGGAIMAVAFVLVNQFLARMLFEQILIVVRMGEDVHALRREVAPESAQVDQEPLFDAQMVQEAVHGAQDTFAQAREKVSQIRTDHAGAAPTVAPAVAPAATQPVDPGWVCAECGERNTKGRFCRKCGTPAE